MPSKLIFSLSFILTILFISVFSLEDGLSNNESQNDHNDRTNGLCDSDLRLETGVCKTKEYKTHILPSRELTIYAIMEHQNIHSVDATRNKYSMDLHLIFYWTDPGIKTRFNDKDKKQGYIPLSSRAVGQMWTPELYISNLGDYRSFINSKHVSSVKILYQSNVFKNGEPTIEYKIQFRAEVYCIFDLTNYPKDSSRCSFIFGSQYENIRYIFLNDALENEHSITGLYSSNVTMDKGQISNNKTFKNSIGLEIKINRNLRPFIYRYYLPSIGAVLISSLSMTLSVDAIQGRVALSATILLATTNLYVTQMVRN